METVNSEVEPLLSNPNKIEPGRRGLNTHAYDKDYYEVSQGSYAHRPLTRKNFCQELSKVHLAGVSHGDSSPDIQEHRLVHALRY